MPHVDPKKKVELLTRFWNEGYILLDNVLTDELINDVLKEVKKLDFVEIFVTLYPEVMDQFREQAKIDLDTSNVMQDVNDIVVEIISDLHTKWSVATKTWHCLKSLPNGQTQQLHRDFPVFETTEAVTKHDWVQASVSIALEDDTRILADPR
ncbi:hypothetical protein P3T76_006619 [Phytophthora citrophthora]|uniref:Phytanoyl-CoA dioxygenase n=1 Tax=Phytophthora citrophthora TaxID=4793 RepID=A0AAD9GPJ8_9STRA|nr:hypothetical protein P3T76_006619 [Phytophthora citrophthora]